MQPSMCKQNIRCNGKPGDSLVTLYFVVDRKRIGFFKFLLEGYDGLALLSTMQADKGLVRIIIPQSRYIEFFELLNAISPALIG
jgi:hypothetical protein